VKLTRSLKKISYNLFLAAKRPLCEEVLVLGDSHAAVFKHTILRLKLWYHHLNVVSVGGATASGLKNPNSKTQASRAFQQALAATRAKKVIVMLGEVDTGFLIWYRADKNGGSVQEALGQALATYQQFLEGIQARGLAPVCVSTPLPTIRDGDKGEVVNARKSVVASQRERTELTLSFNREMNRFCCARGITYVDLDGASLGADGLVKVELLNRNALDHHYEKRVFAGMLSEHLGHVVKAPLMVGAARTRREAYPVPGSRVASSGRR